MQWVRGSPYGFLAIFGLPVHRFLRFPNVPWVRGLPRTRCVSGEEGVPPRGWQGMLKIECPFIPHCTRMQIPGKAGVLLHPPADSAHAISTKRCLQPTSLHNGGVREFMWRVAEGRGGFPLVPMVRRSALPRGGVGCHEGGKIGENRLPVHIFNKN